MQKCQAVMWEKIQSLNPFLLPFTCHYFSYFVLSWYFPLSLFFSVNISVSAILFMHWLSHKWLTLFVSFRYTIWMCTCLWTIISMDSLKNRKALPGEQYQPTDVEHLANVISHGVSCHGIWNSWVNLFFFYIFFKNIHVPYIMNLSFTPALCFIFKSSQKRFPLRCVRWLS